MNNSHHIAFFKLVDTRVQNNKLSTVILATTSSSVVCKVIDNSGIILV